MFPGILDFPTQPTFMSEVNHGAQSLERRMATKNQRVDARLLHLFSGPSDKRDPTTLAYQVFYKGLERKLNIRVDESIGSGTPLNHGKPGVSTSCATRSSTSFLPIAARANMLLSSLAFRATRFA